MRVLVTASFKAPFGGLQANVRAQLRAIRQAESTPVLACDAGRFAEAVRSEGFEVIDGDLLSTEVRRRCIGAGPFDLIHAHPFAARQLGLAVVFAGQNTPVHEHHAEPCREGGDGGVCGGGLYGGAGTLIVSRLPSASPRKGTVSA